MNIYVIYSQVLTNDNIISICHCLVIGRHHFGCRLHIFIMATALERNKKIPVNFITGTILTLKPIQVANTPAGAYELDLCNGKGDVLLHIWFSGGGVIFCNRAHRSLGDGWGKPQPVDITQVDLKGRSLLEVTISIHHYLTESEFGRYQIFFNGTTIAHFEKRFPGPATEIKYLVDTPGGPCSWVIDVYQIDDLLAEERLALVPGR